MKIVKLTSNKILDNNAGSYVEENSEQGIIQAVDEVLAIQKGSLSTNLDFGVDYYKFFHSSYRNDIEKQNAIAMLQDNIIETIKTIPYILYIKNINVNFDEEKRELKIETTLTYLVSDDKNKEITFNTTKYDN